MAILNTEFYQGEDGYSDGSIEIELLEIVKNTKDFEEILRKDNRWPMLYHLSKQRQNILNWYPFDKNADLLEIGSGCGALTGLFCSKVKSVKAIELTKIRAQINYERHKDCDNLEILVGNFNNIKIKHKFDYIILNGVLEYAGSFTISKFPYKDFLINIKQYLKENGKILIAIENRLGIKYFNGAVEDHTARLFDGINNYPGITSVKTFSKSELIEVLESAGLKEHTFYYPVPDYKFPEVIYTDVSLHMMNNNINNRVYNANRLMLYNENEVWESFYNEGILDKFFNSFMVEASLEKVIDDKKVIYAKLSNDRKSDFRIATIIAKDNQQNLEVIKSAQTEKAIEHLSKMADYYEKKTCSEKFENVSLVKNKNSLVFDFIEGPTLEWVLVDCLKKGHEDKFKEIIKDFQKKLLENTELRNDYETDDFKEVFGLTSAKKELHCKKDSNIDLIFSNIIIEREKYKVIDYEWSFSFWIPQEYVLWRSLYYLYIANEEVKKHYSLEELLDLIDINRALHDIFIKWDQCFGNKYVRDDGYKQYIKKVTNVSNQLDKLRNIDSMHSSLYFDIGNGFNEENKIFEQIDINGNSFTSQFMLNDAENIQLVRWDPCEEPCKIKGLLVESNRGIETIEAINCSYEDKEGYQYFITNDPQYCIKNNMSKPISWIKIHGEIKKLESSEICYYYNILAQEYNKKKNENSCLKDENISLQTENEIIKQSTIWKKSEPLRKLLDKLKKR